MLEKHDRSIGDLYFLVMMCKFKTRKGSPYGSKHQCMGSESMFEPHNMTTPFIIYNTWCVHRDLTCHGHIALITIDRLQLGLLIWIPIFRRIHSNVMYDISKSRRYRHEIHQTPKWAVYVVDIEYLECNLDSVYKNRWRLSTTTRSASSEKTWSRMR